MNDFDINFCDYVIIYLFTNDFPVSIITLFIGYGGNDAGGWQGALSLGGGGGGLGGGDIGGGGLGGGGDWAGAASSYGVSSGGGHEGGGSEGGSIGGDFHHGVSIVGTGGGDQKSTVFDLTNQGNYNFVLYYQS